MGGELKLQEAVRGVVRGKGKGIKEKFGAVEVQGVEGGTICLS